MKEYVYALVNEITGLDLVRTTQAKSMADAKQKISQLAGCFGKSTRVISIELAAQPELPLPRKKEAYQRR